MTVYYAPKHIIGDYVLTQDTICSDGKVHPVSVEKYMTPKGEGFMFVILLSDTDRRTNYRLYSSAKGAIKAASTKTL